jgi:hypothetical protein
MQFTNHIGKNVLLLLPGVPGSDHGVTDNLLEARYSYFTAEKNSEYRQRYLL